MNLIQTEPAIIVSLVVAILDCAIAFGAPVSNDQKVALVALADAVVAIVGGILVRSQVTPTAQLAARRTPH